MSSGTRARRPFVSLFGGARLLSRVSRMDFFNCEFDESRADFRRCARDLPLLVGAKNVAVVDRCGSDD